MAGPLLAIIPLFAIGLTIGWALAMPAAIRRGFWIRPRFETLRFDEAITELNRPELAAADARFDELADELRLLGFHETQRLVAPDVASRCTLALLLARDPTTDTMAGIQLVWHGAPSDTRLQLRGEYIGFETQYSPPASDTALFGSAARPITVQTTTSPQLFPAPATHRLLCVDWVKSLRSIYELHALHCQRCRPAESRYESDADSLPERLTRRHARVMAAAVGAGYLQPERPGLLRLTTRGAIRVTTQLIWPLASASRARQRRVTKRMLTAWGASM